MNLYEFDKQYYDEGIELLVGVDEAGRGPLAGPVYAAAVVLPKDFYMEEINDSKKITEKKREYLFDIIIENALYYSIQNVDAAKIDEINILNATFEAMKKAVDALNIKPDLVLVDGNRTKGIEYNTKCVIKGDAKSQSIAAASILAKVSRDRYCKEKMEIDYPEYQFAKHKGYGTKLHCELLRTYGPCKEHRKTFLSKILSDAWLIMNIFSIGYRGETAACACLKSKKYKIIKRNYRKKCGEIDIIAQKDDLLVFVEVKTRKSDEYGAPCEFVTRSKQEKIIKTAKYFLSENNFNSNVSFDVIEVYHNGKKIVKTLHIENAFW